MSKPYDLAIIPCTSGKNPEGLTAATLYKGGPFSLMMRHANQRCEAVVIMSAKYGLLRPSDPVRYYDAYLPELNAQERAELIQRIRDIPWVEAYKAKRICSYLPEAYFQCLAEAKPALCASIAMRRPYRSLPMLTLYKVLSNEIKQYGKSPARR